MANHQGKRHICDICTKSFKTKLSLKNHTDSVHEGKVYSCDLCTKVFKTKLTLKIHIERIHEGKLYLCDICNGAKLGDATVARAPPLLCHPRNL